jgi:transcription termination/antitermination protein NusG
MHNPDQHTGDRGWYAVQVWTGRETFCADHLRTRGQDVFLPCYTEHRRWSDRIKKINRALFAGYVFCRFSLQTALDVLTTPGVIRIVGTREGPLRVPDDEIETIKRIVEMRLVAEPWRFLQSGQRLRLEAGPLRGTEGIVLTIKNRHRLIVAIPLLQRSIAVEVDPDWITIPAPGVPDRACS